MEGLRVRALYAQLGLQHGVTWKGRNYDRQNPKTTPSDPAKTLANGTVSPSNSKVLPTRVGMVRS